MSRILSVLVLTTLLFAFIGCSSDEPAVPTAVDLSIDKARGGNGNPGIIPPHARPHGKTYAEWSAAWWQWLWSAPSATNPGLDTTGDFVNFGQSGKVWFLAPNYGFGQVDHRTATIPKGTMLFIDVAGFFCSPEFGCLTLEEIRAANAEATDGITGIVFEVDGVSYEIGVEYRIESVPFSYTLPEGNMFQYWLMDVPADTYPLGAADTYHVMLAPLSRGEHTIHLFADLGDWGTSEVFFDLTVE